MNYLTQISTVFEMGITRFSILYAVEAQEKPKKSS